MMTVGEAVREYIEKVLSSSLSDEAKRTKIQELEWSLHKAATLCVEEDDKLRRRIYEL